MVRDILKIDDSLCTGCGFCIPACTEGALMIIDGKVRLISDLVCDGLGGCVNECPHGAMSIEKVEIEPYDEAAAIAKLSGQGKNTTLAHLKHLKERGETIYLQEGLEWLRYNSGKVNFNAAAVIAEVNSYEAFYEIIGSSMFVSPDSSGEQHNSTDIEKPDSDSAGETSTTQSWLKNWPIHMNHINPNAACFRNFGLLLAANCVAFAMGDFHSKYLKGKSLAIACPKFDNSTDEYIEKLSLMLENSKVSSVTVMLMDVPCCDGLMQIVKQAVMWSQRKIPVRKITVSINGEVLKDERE